MYKIDFNNKQIAVTLAGQSSDPVLNILSDQEATQPLVGEFVLFQNRLNKAAPFSEVSEEAIYEKPLEQYEEIVIIPSWDHSTYREVVWAAHKWLKPRGTMRGMIPGTVLAGTSNIDLAFLDWFCRNLSEWMFIRATDCGNEVLCLFSMTKPGDMLF